MMETKVPRRAAGGLAWVTGLKEGVLGAPFGEDGDEEFAREIDEGANDLRMFPTGESEAFGKR